MKFWLMPSQFSMIVSSPIFLSISAGSSVANIAAGLGNGMPAGAAPAVDGGVNPGIGMPNGFHIRCMNSSACCGVNGSDDASDMGDPLVAQATGCLSFPLLCYGTFEPT